MIPADFIEADKSPSGAAAPKAATCIPRSLMIVRSALATRGVGSRIFALSRITVTPKSFNHFASYSAESVWADV